MTKIFLIAIGAFALAMVSGLSSCQDEDLGVSETVLKERAFERGFVKEFGQPAADQRWDFYAQMMEKREAALTSKEEEEGITRASSSDFTFTASISRNRKQKRIITGRCQAFGRKKRSLALRIGEKVISFVPAKQEIHNNE